MLHSTPTGCHDGQRPKWVAPRESSWPVASPFCPLTWVRCAMRFTTTVGRAADELVRSGLRVRPDPELGRGPLPQTAVGPMVVVVEPPDIERLLNLDETREPSGERYSCRSRPLNASFRASSPRSTRPAEVELDPLQKALSSPL